MRPRSGSSYWSRHSPTGAGLVRALRRSREDAEVKTFALTLSPARSPGPSGADLAPPAPTGSTGRPIIRRAGRTGPAPVAPLDEHRPPPPVTAPPVALPSGASTPDFVVTPHRRGGSRAVRIVVLVVLGLLLFAGLRVVVIDPVRAALAGPAPVGAPPAPGIDQRQATQLAMAYSADYLSWDSANPGVRTAALARWTGQTPGSLDNWTGTGQLHADTVTAGEVVEVSDTAVVVQTTARVMPAALAPGEQEPDGADSSGDAAGLPRAADPGPATGPWRSGTPLWITLAVPVVTGEDGLRVGSGGAVFTGGSAAALPRTGTESDGRLTAETTELPDDVFSAYGSGDTRYIRAPGTQLTGLSGVASLTDVPRWELVLTPAAEGRYAAADVTWTLANTSLSITQHYALLVQQADDRWLVGSIGARPEE